MRKIGLLFILLSASLGIQAQQPLDAVRRKMKDSITAYYADQAALLYPRIRQFSITHEVNSTGNISSKLYGNDFFKGRFQSSRTTISVSAPLLEGPKFLLVGNLGVVHQFFDMSNVVSFNEKQPVEPLTKYIPMLKAGVSFTHRDTLFNKPVTFTGSVNGLFDPSLTKRRITFLGLISFPLIQRPNTRLMGGIIVNIDPSSPVPAYVFLSYFHKFKGANMDLMIDIPYRVALRKPFHTRSSLTAFAELEGQNSFFQFNNPDPSLPGKMTYSTLEIKSGFLYEYRLTRKLVLSASGGISSTVKSIILAQGAAQNDYFIKNKNSAVPYGQIGISVLPFWRPFRQARF